MFGVQLNAASSRLFGPARPGMSFGCSLASSAALVFALDAPAQRIHQIDDIARLLFSLGSLDFFAARFSGDELPQGGFIPVFELARVEMPRLGIEDVLSELQHVLGDSRAWNIFEVALLVSDRIVIAQRRAEDAFAQGFERDDTLAMRHHDARECDAFLFLEGFADDQ